MKQLRQYIRQILLTESAKGLKDLEAEDLYMYINNWGDGFHIELGEADSPAPIGRISVERSHKTKNCGGAFMVFSSRADQNWGPLLYDIAMELATEMGGGLMADRGSVSGEARAVWDYYMANRGDVTGIQMDDLFNTLTPEEEDNCDQEVAGGRHGMYGGDKVENPDWMHSPLSKRWTKPPTTLNALRAGDRLVEE